MEITEVETSGDGRFGWAKLGQHPPTSASLQAEVHVTLRRGIISEGRDLVLG
jgi:hypothetical protein